VGLAVAVLVAASPSRPAQPVGSVAPGRRDDIHARTTPPPPPRRHDVTITVDLEVATFEPGRGRRGGTADGVSRAASIVSAHTPSQIISNPMYQAPPNCLR
jgi:hypothetical protein